MANPDNYTMFNDYTINPNHYVRCGLCGSDHTNGVHDHIWAAPYITKWVSGGSAWDDISWSDTPTPPCKCGYTGDHYRITHIVRMFPRTFASHYGWERRSSF